MLKQHLALVVVCLAMSVVAACVRAPVKPIEWPHDLPPKDYYEQVYEQDESNQAVQSKAQYLEWVIRFYRGWELHQDGWKMIIRDTLLGIDDDVTKDRVEEKLARLGKLISGEWAKGSESRRIRSRELSIWGQALAKSINRDQEERLVDQVTRDVDALLTHEIDRVDINLGRY